MGHLTNSLIEGLLKSWYIFGENKTTGKVDVADGEGDIIHGITEKNAGALINQRDHEIKMMGLMVTEIEKRIPNFFEEIWLPIVIKTDRGVDKSKRYDIY